MGLWDAKPGDGSRAPWIVTRLGRIQQPDRMGRGTLGSPGCLPARRGWGRLGWGWGLRPGSSSECSHLGCPLHPRVAPFALCRMLPGFCGLVGAVGTKRGPLAPGQGSGEPAGRGPHARHLVGCWERNPCALPTPWSPAKSPPTPRPAGLLSPAVESITSDSRTWLGAKARVMEPNCVTKGGKGPEVLG